MRKRLTAPLLLAGHFVLTLTPVAAMAAPAQPAAGPPATGSYHALHDGCYDDGCRDPYDPRYDHHRVDHRPGQPEVDPQPADVLLGVAVGVAPARAVAAERPVRHRHPHVVERRQLPPGEPGPVLRVDGLDEDGRERDRRQGRRP